MSRKHMPLYIGGGVTLVLAGVLGFFLYQQTGSYSEIEDGLGTAQRKLVKLTNREPFPSERNVEAERKQIESYQQYRRDLFGAMREGQPELWESNRDGFRRRLQECLGELVKDARAKSVVLPPRFPFGFQRYVAGALPEDDEIPRLMGQMQAVTRICQMLYEGGITELRSVERTEFEKNAVAAGGGDEGLSAREMRRRRARGEDSEEGAKKTTEMYVDPDHLFSKEHFAVTFCAADGAQWKILDRMAQGAPFIVVTGVKVATTAATNEVRSASTVATEGAGAASQDGWTSVGGKNSLSGGASEVAPRHLRVCAGKEIPEVRLELDVYWFLDESEETEAEGEE